MPYFYIKRKTKRKHEVVGNYIFTDGVLHVEDEAVANKMKNNLCKYYGARLSNKSPEELKAKGPKPDTDLDEDEDLDPKLTPTVNPPKPKPKV